MAYEKSKNLRFFIIHPQRMSVLTRLIFLFPPLPTASNISLAILLSFYIDVLHFATKQTNKTIKNCHQLSLHSVPNFSPRNSFKDLPVKVKALSESNLTVEKLYFLHVVIYCGLRYSRNVLCCPLILAAIPPERGQFITL